VQEHAVVGRPCLKQTNRVGATGGEAVGQHAAGGTCPDNYVVEFV